MDLKLKLSILADAAKYDASCASSGSKRERAATGLGNTEGMGICHSYTPDGRCISLLKLLLTNVCIWDCSYCVNRRSSNIKRARFTPDEVVRLTIGFYKRNYIEGLFLSSGIIQNPDYTMEQLILVAKRLREDEQFGVVRLRAFGAYSLRVADPAGFIREIAGTNAHFQTEDIDGQLKRSIVTEFSDALGELKIPALDLAAQYKELGEAIRAKINEDFKGWGLEVTKFYVENVSLPPEVEAAMDKRASMGALGDAQKYMQFQAADALRDAAQNEGGGAGLGAGLGAGFAVGGQMANVFGQQAGTAGGTATGPSAECPSCGKQNVAGVKFCSDCGGKMEASKVPCVKCGAELREAAKFCSECGSTQEKAKCSNCQFELAAGAKFCPECGTQTEQEA